MTRIRALTHSGTFHADEVTAFAILRLADDDVPRYFTRSREPALIAQAEFVFDVGGAYDPAAGRYDHHMRNPPRRPGGAPFSAAGLIWRDFGRTALRRLTGEHDDATIEQLWHRIDGGFILPIDRVDNGIQRADALSYVSLIDDCNPTWSESVDSEDAAFLQAASLAESTLARKARKFLAQIRVHDRVLEAAAGSTDPRLLELPVSMPWQGAVFEAGLPVLYALYRDRDGLWRIDCMPSEPGSFHQRQPLPRAWSGLRDEALQRATGVADAVFVHPARFTGGARSREGALAMARIALAHPSKQR